MPPDTGVAPRVNPRARSAEQGEINFPAHVARAWWGGGLPSPHTTALGEISTPGPRTPQHNPRRPLRALGGVVLGKVQGRPSSGPGRPPLRLSQPTDGH